MFGVLTYDVNMKLFQTSAICIFCLLRIMVMDLELWKRQVKLLVCSNFDLQFIVNGSANVVILYFTLFKICIFFLKLQKTGMKISTSAGV